MATRNVPPRGETSTCAGAHGVTELPQDLPPSITRTEKAEYDEYAGTAEDLIAAGLVRPEQFPPEGRSGISYLNGVQVRGNCRKDETYLRVQHWYDGTVHVRRGLSREEIAARRAAEKERWRKGRAERNAEERAEEQRQREIYAKRDRSDLASMPKSEGDFRRYVIGYFRQDIARMIEQWAQPSNHHGFRIAPSTAEQLCLASDAMVDLLINDEVIFDAELQRRIIERRRATIRAADPKFERQFNALAVPNPSILQGEQA